MPRTSNSQKKLHVKRGDQVQIITGNDKGAKGRVLSVFPSKERVLVEGVNLKTHHDKPSQQNQQGGRIKREAPVHVSNVMLIDPKTGNPTRIGRRKIEGAGKNPSRWVRYSKDSNEVIDK